MNVFSSHSFCMKDLIQCFVLYLKQYISMGLEDSIPIIVWRVKDDKRNLIFIIELHTDILFKQHLKILWSILLGFYLLVFFRLRLPFPTYFEIQEKCSLLCKVCERRISFKILLFFLNVLVCTWQVKQVYVGSLFLCSVIYAIYIGYVCRTFGLKDAIFSLCLLACSQCKQAASGPFLVFLILFL